MKKLIIILGLLIAGLMGCQQGEKEESKIGKTKVETSSEKDVAVQKENDLETAINSSGEETSEEKPQENKQEGKKVSAEPEENKEDSSKQPVTNQNGSKKESDTMDIISETEAEELVTNYVKETGRTIKEKERISYDHKEGYNLIVHYYEQREDHTATINWYEVDGVTGAVIPQF